ncbi:hypothetical protein Tco_0753827 [Tanacetum coccineum]
MFDEESFDEEGVITDFSSLPTKIEVSPTPTLRIHNIYPKSQMLGDPKSAVQTRSKVQQKSGAHALFNYIQKQQRNNHKDQHHCQEHNAVAQSQPSSSTLPVPSTSSPPVQSPPFIPTPTPIPASIPTPTPIPETEPEPIGHTFEEPSPAYQHFSPPQEQAQ